MRTRRKPLASAGAYVRYQRACDRWAPFLERVMLRLDFDRLLQAESEALVQQVLDKRHLRLPA